MQGGEAPDAAGVYVVKFPGGWVYCGASWRLAGRLKSHFSQLGRRVHKNPRLQSVWDECGGAGVEVVWRAVAVESSEALHPFELRLVEYWQGRVGAARLLNVALHLSPIRSAG